MMQQSPDSTDYIHCVRKHISLTPETILLSLAVHTLIDLEESPPSAFLSHRPLVYKRPLAVFPYIGLHPPDVCLFFGGFLTSPAPPRQFLGVVVIQRGGYVSIPAQAFRVIHLAPTLFLYIDKKHRP